VCSIQRVAIFQTQAQSYVSKRDQTGLNQGNMRSHPSMLTGASDWWVTALGQWTSGTIKRKERITTPVARRMSEYSDRRLNLPFLGHKTEVLLKDYDCHIINYFYHFNDLFDILLARFKISIHLVNINYLGYSSKFIISSTESHTVLEIQKVDKWQQNFNFRRTVTLYNKV